MNKIILSSAFFLTTCLFAPLVLADFYKYVDKNGVVHLTNVPASKNYVWVMRETGSKTRENTVVITPTYDELIRRVALRHGVDPGLVRAIVKAESDFDAFAISRKGARGLMQLMPETALLMGVKNVHDPAENVDGGIRYLSRLLKTFNSNVRLAVAAYNAGENAVVKYGAVPPYPETKNYVKRVLYYYNSYKKSSNNKRITVSVR